MNAAELTAAMRRVSIASGVMARQIQASMERIGKALSDAIAGYFRRPWPDPPIPLHGFTPNYDLVCAVCSVGPEECRGGRA